MNHPPTTEAEGLLEKMIVILLKYHESEPHAYLEAAEIMQLLQLETAKAMQEAKLEAIEMVYMMSPQETFEKWKPEDAVRFYTRLRQYEQQLQKGSE
jgi:hypothetical protein